MKIRPKAVLSVLLLCCLLINSAFVNVLAADDNLPAASDNYNQNNYTAYDAEAVKSYLYQDGNNLVRVEYISGNLIIEYYSENFELLSSKSLALDSGFDLWGGFYAGEEYNFVIVGQENPEQSNNVEVIRVIKYDKQWNRLGETGLFGANTFVPFDFGSLRCAEYGGILYVHTCHTMYASADGLNHQANMTFSVRESDMEVTDAQYEVSNSAFGYVSHSFNQFILIDDEANIITLNHGDVYPRAAVLMRCGVKAGTDSFDGLADEVNLYEFPQNSMMYQKTGASLGGLAETSKAYITVYNNDGVGGYDDTYPRNVFLTVTDKDNFSKEGTVIHQITDYSKDTYSAGTPVLVSNQDGGGYVLWDEQVVSNSVIKNSVGQISYASYDQNGNVSSLKTVSGMLSDCQPIMYNGRAVWYVTDNSAPIFYILDETGLSEVRTGFNLSDVSADSWYYDYALYAYKNGLILASGDKFEPDKNADRGTFVYALYKLEGGSEPFKAASFSDVPLNLSAAVSWAAENNIVNGVSASEFAPSDSITREQLAALLYRYAEFKGYDTSSSNSLDRYEDAYLISDYAKDAVKWANAEGLITGDSETTLNPKGNATRAEIAAILMRFETNIL